MKKHHNNHSRTLFWLLAAIVLCAAATGGALACQFHVLAGCSALILAGLVWGTIHFDRSTKRKLAFLFDAIENDDYAFRFAEEYPQNADDPVVNRSLNRMKEILAKARDRTIVRERYYQVILERINTGIVVINQQGHVLQTNREAVRLLGVSPLTHVRQTERVDDRLPGLLMEITPGESRQLEWMNERGAFTLSIHASIFEQGDQQLKILALSDIGNELSDREIESWVRLIRILTHEMMNSLNPIISLSDSLVERLEQEDKTFLKQGLRTIHQTASGLTSFLESYRQFTRIPSLHRSLFYVAEFLEEQRSLILATLPDGESPIDIALHVDPSDLILHADKGLVGQVMINLLKNAIEAIRGAETPTPRIEITATVDASEQVVIAVRNNGPNIPAEEVDHIFVPFFTTKAGGSGIGLSLSRQIMRQHGGTLTYRPVAEGSGSLFVLTFR